MTAANPTAINDIDDLLRILEQNPELAAQLQQRTADPRIAELTRLIADLGQIVQANAAAIGRLNAAQEKTDTALQELAAQQKETKAHLQAFIAEQRALNAAADQRQQEYWARQDNLNAEFRHSINTLTDSLNHLKGENAERKAEANIGNVLRKYDRRLRRAELLKSSHLGTGPETEDALADALEDGRIAQEEYDQLDAVDLIVRAYRRGQQEPIYFAIEVSRTLYPEDWERAKERAAILAKALTVSAQGIALGAYISDYNRQEAAKNQAAFITYANLAE